MAQPEHLITPTRGPSRFRVAVKPMTDPVRPYAWEIFDEERNTEEPVRRSARRFRTPKEAWEAGRIALEKVQSGSLSIPPPTPDTPDEPRSR